MNNFKLADLAATSILGARLGALLLPGDCVVLTGELGTGKTTLTKGIAQGLGIEQLIKSPTYTLVREYLGGRLPLYHMDVYRLSDGEGTDLGLDDYFMSDGVCIVEWGQNIVSDLPLDYLELTLTYGEQTDDRLVAMTATGSRSQALLKQLNELNLN